MGRKTKYNERKAVAICELIATTSRGMKSICEELGIPVRTALDWLAGNTEFSQRYARAKELQADMMAEEIIEIADDGTNDYMTIVKGDVEYNVENKEVTNRSRLRVDARKWVAAKLKPKKYGDKVDVTSGGEKIGQDLSKLSIEELELLERIQAKVDGEGNPDTA